MSRKETDLAKEVYRRLFKREFRLIITEEVPCTRQRIGYNWISSAGEYKWVLQDLNGVEIQNGKTWGMANTKEQAKSTAHKLGGKIVR